MGNPLDSWFCPLCGQALALTPYPKGGGFRLDCYGADSVPHRLRIYLDKFRKDASFLPGPKVSAETQHNSRIKELLARAEKLAS
jgi:hypothetical protein